MASTDIWCCKQYLPQRAHLVIPGHHFWGSAISSFQHSQGREPVGLRLTLTLAVADLGSGESREMVDPWNGSPG